MSDHTVRPRRQGSPAPTRTGRTECRAPKPAVLAPWVGIAAAESCGRNNSCHTSDSLLPKQQSCQRLFALDPAMPDRPDKSTRTQKLPKNGIE